MVIISNTVSAIFFFQWDGKYNKHFAFLQIQFKLIWVSEDTIHVLLFSKTDVLIYIINQMVPERNRINIALQIAMSTLID